MLEGQQKPGFEDGLSITSSGLTDQARVANAIRFFFAMLLKSQKTYALLSRIRST